MSEKTKARVDMFGRAIKLGHFMVYPSTLGRSGTLMVVQVVEFVDASRDEWACGPSSTNLRMRVRAMSQYYGGPKAKSKLSLINFPERGMIVPADALSDECLELIRAVPDKAVKP
jgi:hypothetical protein